MSRRSRSARARIRTFDIIFAPPAADDVVVLLRAWRFWLFGGLIGALLGAAIFASFPPPYRARATANVDFHLELAWPQNTDREQFYYLERETRKLVEIAYSDATLGEVAEAVPGTTIEEMRSGILQLSQPGNGGWHFHADDRDPERAALLSREWARAFAHQVQQEIAAGSPGGLEAFITASVVQAEAIIPERTESVGLYMLVGAGIVLSLAALGILIARFGR